VIRQLDFPDERAAKAHLEALLSAYFLLKREVGCRHLLAGNRPRIDYVARPKSIPFPFDWFGEIRERHEAFWVNRLAGKFHVGCLYDVDGRPAFYACADRQWCAHYGARASKHNSRQLIGSGAVRRA
jgi:hypothetical protein